MTQVSASEVLSMVANKIEISTNGSSWTDASGYSGLIEPGEMTRNSGVAFTYSGDKAIIKGGKLQPLTLDVTLLYTEDASAIYTTLLTQFQTAGGGALYLRWSPKGGASTQKQYTSDAGIITKLQLPGGDPEKGEPVKAKFTLQTPYVTQSTIS